MELELVVCLPMFRLVVVYLRALLNYSSLFVYLCLCLLLCISELCGTGVICFFTNVYVGCCVSQSSAELEFFVSLPMFMLVAVYFRPLLNWTCLFTYVCWLLCISELC